MSRENIYIYEEDLDDGFEADATDIGYELGRKASNNALPTRRIKKKRKKKYILLKLLVVIAIAIGLYFFGTSSFFTIEKITIKTTSHFQPEQIEAMSGIKKGNNLWETSMGAAKKRIQKDPYAGNVRVSRRLPNEVYISVKERVEFACIYVNKSYIVVDSLGIALRKTKESPKLPVLDGIKVKPETLGKSVEMAKNGNSTTDINSILDFIKKMEDLDMYFYKLRPGDLGIKAWVYGDLGVAGSMANIEANIDELKKTIIDLDTRGIDKGTIQIGESTCSYSPKLLG